MANQVLHTFREASMLLGVRRETVADLIRTHSIPVLRHPNSPGAKAIDAAGLETLRRLLKPKGKAAPASA